VFPFDRPLPPGAGDNQALTVNTKDGSVAYDVSFALVWANGDTAVNRNEAYAFASCADCRTVAVAFQVVLLVGSVDVVVPENLSAAVNYGCLRCVTYALATQLVLTVPGELSEQGTRELAAVWAEVQAFGEQIADVPLSELRARLTEYERRISAVVQREGQPVAPGEGAVTTPSAGTSSAAASPTGSGPAGGTAGRTSTSAPTGTSSSRTSAGPTSAGATSAGTPATTPATTPSTTSAPVSESAGTTAAGTGTAAAPGG
jgi:putative peptide zinc metalloprotease protein